MGEEFSVAGRARGTCKVKVFHLALTPRLSFANAGVTAAFCVGRARSICKDKVLVNAGATVVFCARAIRVGVTPYGQKEPA